MIQFSFIVYTQRCAIVID